ncbi:HipA domain-containing protein [Bacillus sp. REN16]|uniref:HipA domain-containing protein n=1 Tax=Bacillus sp. REN16 TaxID=2887296 RepID=UPI001E4B4E5F|nr:HipA domain-containing protein [Bacillus sp. REN16]MCC3356124.1 HipA domain-containing protein [Bacillus sp. REN16]
MRDVTNWTFISHGEKSTLEKVELLSPDENEYIMKYPRELSGDRVNWEDVNEVIGAKIAQLLNLKTVEAEIAYRNGKRGCLMLHFLRQYDADQGEPGAGLLSAFFGEEYEGIQNSDLNSFELLIQAFNLIERYPVFNLVKYEYISMNVFDILIGNQDRHPFNWQLLFKGNDVFFGPLYDNGASLGWQLPEQRLEKIIQKEEEMLKLYKKMKVKIGLIENTQPPIKAQDVLEYCKMHFPNEIRQVLINLEEFNLEAYNDFIDTFPLISTVRKHFLKEFIRQRINKIIFDLRKGG